MNFNCNYEHNLYYTQHKWLPYVFYGATIPFMEQLRTEQGQLFVDLIHAMHEDEETYQCPIVSSDFEINSYIDGDQTIMHIIMPEPLDQLYCRSVYLCYDSSSKKKAYFTVELSKSYGYYICSWTENRAHIIFDEAPDTIEKELNKIKHYFSSDFSLDNVIAVTVPSEKTSALQAGIEPASFGS